MSSSDARGAGRGDRRWDARRRPGRRAGRPRPPGGAAGGRPEPRRTDLGLDPADPRRSGDLGPLLPRGSRPGPPRDRAAEPARPRRLAALRHRALRAARRRTGSPDVQRAGPAAPAGSRPAVPRPGRRHRRRSARCCPSPAATGRPRRTGCVAGPDRPRPATLWLPLLRAKLGEEAERASARFIRSTFRRLLVARLRGGDGDRFGWVEGGYAAVLGRLAAELEACGRAMSAPGPRPPP